MLNRAIFYRPNGKSNPTPRLGVRVSAEPSLGPGKKTPGPALKKFKLKLIKNYLRTTLLQERLTNQTLLFIENEISEKLNCDDIT